MVQASSIESSVVSFERNAFRLLSLPADAQAKEIYRQQQRIQNALELGDDDVVSNFAFLPKVSLSAEAILEAVNRVERQRAVEELFWVHQVGGKFDFESGTIEKVLSSLRADAGQNTTKGSVAQHNLAVIFTCLAHGLNGSRRLDYWKDAIQYWNATLANDVFWQFMQDRDELAGLNGGSPSPNDLRSIAREVIQRAMLTQIWIAIDNREYNEIATLLSIIREYKQLFEADSTLSAVGNRMAKDGSVAIGGILDRVSAIPEGADKTIARATLDTAEEDLHRIGENFDAIIQAFGAANAFAGLYDARALALKKLSVAFFNLVGDEQAALRLAMAAGAIACDPNLRDEAEVGCRFIRRSLCCSEAVVFIEQKNYAAAEEKFASALTLSTDEQKAEILELQQGVRRARIFGNVDTTSRSPSLSTFNGIGAKFYGSRDFDKETNSYITVHWFVFFYLPIIPIACYRVADRGHNLYTIYGRVPLTPLLRKYRWGALAAAALLVIGLMVNSGSSSGNSASTYTPPSVSSQPTESFSTNTSQSSEKEAIEAERAELKRLSDSLDLQKQDIDQQSADLKRMQSYIRSVKDEYTEGAIPEDVQEQYNTTVDDYNNKLPSYNAAVRGYNSDLQQYQERIAAFNGRVNHYNATQ